MILPVLKFVVFSLAPFLLLLWLISPDLWSKITSSAQLVGDHPSSFLDLPSGLLLSGEAVVKSLTCDDLDLNAVDYVLPFTEGEKTSVPPPFSTNESVLVSPEVLEIPPPVVSRAPWVITGLMLMGLNSYFPQLSPVSSFWSPLRAAIPVLHWAASWWFLSPGWEPNLVSLAPLSYTQGLQPKSPIPRSLGTMRLLTPPPCIHLSPGPTLWIQELPLHAPAFLMPHMSH
ncbi:hypothetical protein DSO57_1003275 [Entomophthora muscae]|uniref:Uncharacterized protein n=1 Tax=Entomophthora muscae TaxID=34485 RepID=A0ACC2SLC6_9FUNG|nr:hypothetical protein DSO57_1003275 [Entomophthora muscae]